MCEADKWLMDEEKSESHAHLEMVSEPNIIMTTDQQGVSIHLASDVMVVKDMQGRSRSRLLRVLINSGDSGAMCHRRVVPRGVMIHQGHTRTLINRYPVTDLGEGQFFKERV